MLTEGKIKRVLIKHLRKYAVKEAKDNNIMINDIDILVEEALESAITTIDDSINDFVSGVDTTDKNDIDNEVARKWLAEDSGCYVKKVELDEKEESDIWKDAWGN
jgi:hypothetical protein